MKRNKLIASCLSVMITVPLIVGCGNKGTSNLLGDNGENKKDVHISMLFADNPTSPYKSDWKVLEWIKEKTGVTFDMQVVPVSDLNTKKNMLFNSGNIPDIITHTYPTIKESLSGILLPINKYIDKLPNLKKFLKDNNIEDAWENLKVADGNIYTLPSSMHKFRYQSKQWIIRKDIFEKNNIPVPKTLEEVYEAGKKLKEIYPDSTPITNRFGSNTIMTTLSSAFDTISGGSGDGTRYNFDTKQYEYGPTTDNWKDMVTYANKLYRDGILDQEYATLDSVTYEQKITQGETFIIIDWSQNISRYMPEGKKIDPNYDLEVIYPPTGYDGKYAMTPTSPWSLAWCLPASLEDDPEHLDEVLAYLNWGYSDEAETLVTFGKKGETYEEKDGVKKFKDDKNYIAEYGLTSPSVLLREDVDFLTGSFSKEQKELVYKICEECVPPTAPSSPLTEEELEDIEVYQTSLKDYTASMMEKFINGSEPLSNWDNFVSQCKAKGSDKLVDTNNRALKKMNN